MIEGINEGSYMKGLKQIKPNGLTKGPTRRVIYEWIQIKTNRLEFE